MMRDTGIRLRLTCINTRALISPTAFVRSAWKNCMPNGSTKDQQLKLRPRKPDIGVAVAVLFQSSRQIGGGTDIIAA
jgi:hypothetical protein